MAVSTILAFTAALKENLEARPSFKRVSVVDGPPDASVAQIGEWVMLGDVDGEQTFATINVNTRPKDEVFTIDLYVDIVQQADQITVNNRANDILAEIEAELRADPAQGVTGVRWCLVRALKLQKSGGSEWRRAVIVAGIEVHARI